MAKAKKVRGILLSSILGLEFLLGFFMTMYYSFRVEAVNSVLVDPPSWLPFYFFFFATATLISLGLIWLWKKKGVYLLFLIYFLGYATNLIFLRQKDLGTELFSYFLTAFMLLVWFIAINRKWKFFED